MSRLYVSACLLALLGIGVSPAIAHQTASDKGVSVTMHVTPDDEPVAGRSARITVTKVRARHARFSWRSCSCHLRVIDSSGRVVLNRRVGRRTSLVFPRRAAYEITFSGRVKRGSRKVSFRVPFAIRAS
jgi:hypothetical protein